MLLVVHRGSEEIVQELFQKWDLDAEVIGTVTDSQRLRATFEGRLVVDIPIEPLTDGAPVLDRPAAEGGAEQETPRLVLADLARQA